MDCPYCGTPGAFDLEPGIHGCHQCGEVWADPPSPFPPLPDPPWINDKGGTDADR